VHTRLGSFNIGLRKESQRKNFNIGFRSLRKAKENMGQYKIEEQDFAI
jgi:hypothetical protein